jgi:signal transduction histidine kinase
VIVPFLTESYGNSTFLFSFSFSEFVYWLIVMFYVKTQTIHLNLKFVNCFVFWIFFFNWWFVLHNNNESSLSFFWFDLMKVRVEILQQRKHLFVYFIPSQTTLNIVYNGHVKFSLKNILLKILKSSTIIWRNLII